MHIPDGILPMSVCAAGYAVTGAVTWYSMRKINQMEDPQASIPKAALLASAFFVASWIHIPVPPVSVHLILNGLMGVVLGWFAFPAILIGLFFQAIMFNHGGLTTLGVNAAMMGIPALAAYGIFQLRHRFGGDTPANLARFAFLGGALGLGLAAAIAFPTLIYTIPGNIDAAAERASITVLLLAHLPLMFIEGAFTAMLVSFLYRVKPELIRAVAA
jgi:cobalt/nickel transport system permease protein